MLLSIALGSLRSFFSCRDSRSNTETLRKGEFAQLATEHVKCVGHVISEDGDVFIHTLSKTGMKSGQLLQEQIWQWEGHARAPLSITVMLANQRADRAGLYVQ